MNKHCWLSVGGMMGLFLVALSGCGFASSSSGESSNAGTSSSGAVSISTDHMSYTPDDVIKVSVTNHLQTSIFSYDTRASCTILGLQMQVNSKWQDTQIARCSLGRPAMVVEIAAGKVYTGTIAAGSSGVSRAVFPPGSYRLILTYATSATALSQQANNTTTTMYSKTFVVA